jgi:hypothetical protein
MVEEADKDGEDEEEEEAGAVMARLTAATSRVWRAR